MDEQMKAHSISPVRTAAAAAVCSSSSLGRPPASAAMATSMSTGSATTRCEQGLLLASSRGGAAIGSSCRESMTAAAGMDVPPRATGLCVPLFSEGGGGCSISNRR
eukprot:scaffold69933_cov25-Tisochrysis_lutea.AAC.5